MTTDKENLPQDIKIDIGCGGNKKEGCLGIDIMALPGVDYALDLVKQPLPFVDQSVSYIFSAHFLEHIQEPNLIFPEITRVAKNGAQLEFWTPYAFTNAAFITGHVSQLNEDQYMHICVWFPELWEKVLKARWLLKEIHYVVDAQTLIDLYENKINLDYALKYYKEVIKEFGVYIEVQRDYQGTPIQPRKTFSLERNSTKYNVKVNNKSSVATLEKAIAAFSEA